MRRYIIEDTRQVPPFNEPASLLTIGTEPLKIHHEHIFAEIFNEYVDLAGTWNFDESDGIKTITGEAVVYRDSLWFDREFVEYFITEARKTGKACQAVFPDNDKAFNTYTLKLTSSFKPMLDPKTNRVLFQCDLWYFPDGYTEDIEPIVVPSDAREIGFYSVPDFMSMRAMRPTRDEDERDKDSHHDLTMYAPMRSIISIESWVHVYFATIIFGNFGRAARLDRQIETSLFGQLRMLWRSIIEQRQILSSSAAIEIGRNVDIDPSAIITGPAKIGDNCSIGAGVVLDNCTIGNNVDIDAGCVLKMSTVADNCFLPFRASLYLTSVMESTIIAQNTCLQMCVIGRNSFVGAGNTFTDFNLIAQKPIRATNINDDLQTVGQVVLGSAVGHNCRVGSGMIIFPGRMIESDVVLVASPNRRVIAHSVRFEESDHHSIKFGDVHKRLYPREDEFANQPVAAWDSWDNW